MTLFAGIREEGDEKRIHVSVYSSLGVTGFSGLANLFIPILIASLIVLNTMMGSVYERFREIGIYSSVGLAPGHIAWLFMAESCVYSVLGVVAGFLTGQTDRRRNAGGLRPVGRLHPELLVAGRRLLLHAGNGGGAAVHPVPGAQGLADGGTRRHPQVAAAAIRGG